MPYTVPTCEPDQITAGDTASWKRSFTDFPISEGWALTYSFIPKGGENPAINITTTNDGFYFIVNQSSANWMPGDYLGQGYVTLTSPAQRYQVWEGPLTVRPNLAGASAGDIRTHARKVLDAIQAVLEKRATQEILKWTVEGVVLEKATTAELTDLRKYYKAIVQKEDANERIRNGKASGRRILTKFCRPGFRNTWPPGFVRG